MAWCDVVERRTLRSRQSSVCPPSRTGRGMPGGGRRRRRCSHERVRWRRIATTTNSFRYPCWRSWSGCTSRRCGRLPVIYDTRTTFRRLRARATPADARAWRCCMKTLAGAVWPAFLVILRRIHTTGMKSKVHPTYKRKYRVANWAAYNQALVRRGDVTVWLSSEATAAWTPRRSGRRGGVGSGATRISPSRPP